MNIPVLDLHCDTAYCLYNSPNGSDLHHNSLHVDIERAGKLAGYAQVFACFTSPNLPGDPHQILDGEYAAIRRHLDLNSDRIRIAGNGRQILDNHIAGFMSAVLALEGTAGIHYDPACLEDLCSKGFRIVSLCWNEKNLLTGSHLTGGGLSDQGKAFLKEMQRLGMLVDVSHISDDGFWDVVELSNGPILATHSNSRSIRNVSRNLTDDMFLAICRSGGLAGINLYADFLGNEPSLDTVCDHIFHFLELDPSGKHIALGGDMDGCDMLPRGFNGVQDYPKLAGRLAERGLSEEILLDIFWYNGIGVLNRCCM